MQGTGAVAVNGLPVYYNGVKTGVADGGITITTGVFLSSCMKWARVTVVDMGGPISRHNHEQGRVEFASRLHAGHLQSLAGNIPRSSGDHRKKAGLFLKLMAKQGAVISASRCRTSQMGESHAQHRKRMGGCERKEGLPAKAVMKTFMDVARSSGAKPLRNWDEGL